MRISFKQLALNISKCTAERSEDQHRKVGCCIMNKQGRILSVGYNGLKSKFKTDQSFWKDRDNRRKYVIHAEINALACISKCEKPYIIASTLLPCSFCAAAIASMGIEKVVYIDEYETDLNSKDIFKFYKIKLERHNK